QAIRGRGTDRDHAGGRVLSGSLNGMRGVDDQIEKYLVQLADVALHVRQVAELRFDTRQQAVFVPGDHQRVFQRAVDVRVGVFTSLWKRELFHGAHDSRDARDTVEGAIKGARNLRLQEIEFDCLLRRLGAG